MKRITIVFSIIILLFFSCNKDGDSDSNDDIIDNTDDVVIPPVNYADIDFSNWKVTLPVDENNNGGPDEYQPLHW